MSNPIEIHHVLTSRKSAPKGFGRAPRVWRNTEADSDYLPFVLDNPIRSIPDMGRTIFVYQDVPGFKANSGGGPVVDNAHLALIFWGEYW